jgi:murein DD-endopeptidase MepM/ murein hydrolase activator NlpD
LFLRLEELESRITPDINLTNAFLVNAHDQPVTVPDKGEEVFVQANWSTQGLPADAMYRISYNIDGIYLYSPTLTAGAGHTQTEYWYWWLGGWYASPGTHTVTVTIDPTIYGNTSRTFNFTPVSAADLPAKFITPLGGIPFQTWGIVNYVDVDPRSGGFQDYNGGPYTYDGHTGHDITLANFGSMDDGVPDYAAAAGTVIAVQDGNYDRNMACTSAPANYVIVDHGNGWNTIYYHLRTNSIVVHVGDHVVAGQVLGLAGSAGCSTLAHLHFEVQHNGDIVEPEYDPTTFWISPLPYQGSLSNVVAAGVTSSHTALVTDQNAEERPVSANVFRQVSGQEFSMWFNGFTRTNDAAAFRVYKPDGTHYPSLDRTFTASLSRGGWWYYYLTLPANLDLGTWQVAVELNGTEMARSSFQVTADGAGAAHVLQGSTYVPNGRTTPIDFGTVDPGTTPPQRTFTVSNVGSAPLTLTNLVLPGGYRLVGSFPGSIAIGGSATFTVEMGTATSGTYAGILSFQTSDPNAGVYSFDVKGTVRGGPTGAIHGQVFNDRSGDGVENGSDAGLTGWTVSLLNTSNQVIATTITVYNGYYAFLNVAPGTYRVRETLQPGYSQSTKNHADVTVGTTDVLASPFGVGIYVPTHFVVTAPTSTTAGAAVTFTVTAEDDYGNIAAGYTGTAHFRSGDPYGANLPADYTFQLSDQGTVTFTAGATLYTAGSEDITATDTTSGITGSATVTVLAAPAVSFAIAVPPTVSSGAPFSITVSAIDPYGNVDPNYVTDPSGVVTFYTTTDNDPGVVLPADYQFTPGDAGVHTFDGVIYITPGVQDINAYDTVSGIGGSNTFTVISGPSDAATRRHSAAHLGAWSSGAPEDTDRWHSVGIGRLASQGLQQSRNAPAEDARATGLVARASTVALRPADLTDRVLSAWPVPGLSDLLVDAVTSLWLVD